mmetsp:Transcript_32888/g.90836  ORF Transcript_32888/g.90836 Transcript_32888/m.90836 type:complete len:224 (-) Transcript_32888:498-1169(-)
MQMTLHRAWKGKLWLPLPEYGMKNWTYSPAQASLLKDRSPQELPPLPPHAIVCVPLLEQGNGSPSSYHYGPKDAPQVTRLMKQHYLVDVRENNLCVVHCQSLSCSLQGQANGQQVLGKHSEHRQKDQENPFLTSWPMPRLRTQASRHWAGYNAHHGKVCSRDHGIKEALGVAQEQVCDTAEHCCAEPSNNPIARQWLLLPTKEAHCEGWFGHKDDAQEAERKA